MALETREAQAFSPIGSTPALSVLAPGRRPGDNGAAPGLTPHSRERRMRVRSIVVGGVLAATSACVVWREVPLPEPPAPPNVVTDVSRVRLQNGQSTEFLTLVVATDSLFGIRNNLARTRMSVSFEQVRRIEVRKRDPVRTLGVIGLVVLGAAYSGITGFKPK